MFSNEKWFGAEAPFYSEAINQSLRFEDGDSSYLLRTPSGTGNRKTWTISYWVKIGNTGLTSNIISVFSSSSNQTVNRFYQDKLYLYDFGGSYLISTNRVFRDTTNWYHILWRFDSTQSTTSERIKLYINGTLETDLNDTDYPSLNHDSLWNHTNKHLIGARTDNSTPTPIQRFDGYLAEFNLVDGQALGPESFGETKNGVWIPKPYSGVYGTNGFRLTFGNASNLGEDSAGSNDFSSSGLASTDVVLDSPTNNFCTLNALSGGLHNATLSEGNLKASGNDQARIGTFGMTSGKWYWEGRCGTIGGSNFIGIVRMDYALKNQGSSHTYGRVYANNGYLYIHDSSSSVNTSTTYTTGDKIGVAVDLDAGTIKWYKNGSEVSSSTISDLNTHADGDQGWLPWTNFGNGTGNFVLNFGQDSSFAGLETAQNNADGNGKGDFYYTPPSGYLALCSANLPDLSIGPAQNTQADDHFDTITYTGSASNQTITTNFQADWLWFKERTTNGIQPQSFDSSRPHATTGVKLQSRLEPHQNLAETDSVAIQSQSGNDLVLLGGVSTTNDASGRTYVMWHWKANGGTTTSDSTGSLTVARQTNATAEFSIITGTTSNVEANDMTETFGHGLSGTPDFLIIKGRSHTDSWHVWTSAIPITDVQGLQFNSTNGLFTNSSYKTAQATSTLVKIGRQAIENNGRTFVCYAFKSVEGYSKFGRYESNNNSDGTFVYTGFRPAFLITKDVDRNSMSWIIYDNKRDTSNEMNNNFNIGTSSEPYASTGSSIDFLSNGFKFRDGSSSWNNYSTETYIYMAFAEQPFRFSNAR